MQKFVSIAATVAALTIAAAGPALARDLNNNEVVHLPDGSLLVQISNKQGGIIAPGQASTIMMICNPKCSIVNVQTVHGPGILTGVPTALVQATGFYAGLHWRAVDTTQNNVSAFGSGGNGGNSASSSGASVVGPTQPNCTTGCTSGDQVVVNPVNSDSSIGSNNVYPSPVP